MKVFPVTPDALSRLAGVRKGDDERQMLVGQVLRIAKAQRSLTNPKSGLYGQTFWMVTMAEALEDAEKQAAELRAQLDAMDEHHGIAQQKNALRWHGFLPPMTPAEAAQEVRDILHKSSLRASS